MGNCNATCLKPTNNDKTTMNLTDNQEKNTHAIAGSHHNVNASKKGVHSNKDVADQSQQSEEDEEDDFDDDFAAEAIKKKNERGHRTISAEAYGKYNKKGEFKAKVIPKSDEQKKRIIERLEKAFMFSALDEKEKAVVVDAMVERRFKPAEYVIKQGDHGDNLYVVDQGQLDCSKSKPGQPDMYLKTYQPGESFGELSLLYNCPRAASIKAKTDAVLFELDRETFNNIVKESAVKKRERYEDFLQKVEILKGMDPYERSKIADVLKTAKYRAGDYIIRQGEKGDTFFFIEEGEATATKKDTPNGPENVVYQYKKGDFFGELALRNNEPRKANIVATTDVTVAVIDRDSFRRVLGPVDELLQKQTKKYVGYN